jgi:pimeloyl-ACP methyl ester carboxylesterase
MSNPVNNYRTYGPAPYSTAVVHGGPGAAGEMAPVARELARDFGILEPLQTAPSLEGQVEELRMTLETHAMPPVTLVGYSWGAWLSFIVAARYAALVRKLILVASGPFEQRYVAQLQETRLKRLSEKERAEWQAINEALSGPAVEGNDALLARLGALASKPDAFDPIPNPSEAADALPPRADVFAGVWATAAERRASGKLLELGKQIHCPVVAIHGDYDPHPAAGVQEPLSTVLENFRFVLLKNCGHTPWLERQARDDFYEALRRELAGWDQ